MYKKTDFNNEINELKRKGITSWSGSITKLRITITSNNGELNKYCFLTKDEYREFHKEIRKIYEGD